MGSAAIDLKYITRPSKIDSGRFYKDFKEKGSAEDDLSVATLKHRKNGNCIYNLSRYLERL